MASQNAHAIGHTDGVRGIVGLLSVVVFGSLALVGVPLVMTWAILSGAVFKTLRAGPSEQPPEPDEPEVW